MGAKKNSPGLRKGKNRQTIKKQDRSHRRCPACGGTQPGAAARATGPKANGTAIRQKARRAAEASRALAVSATQVAADPIDPATVIKGVVDGLQAALGEASASQITPAALMAAARKAVLDEFRTRSQFAGRIAEIDVLLRSLPAHAVDEPAGGPAAVSLLTQSLDEHLRDLGIRRVDTADEGEAFVVTEGEGETFEILRPAYVDEMTGKVILAGWLRRVPAADASEIGGGNA
ncbi:hypothetical protein ABZT45_11330 [Streptomyces sp. NPDC005356]|uniref:hypothetical protein n=1 Tax=Streptomyces sp. NPDC005356 TaxID=3157167 RepID=UPI0033A0C24D